MMVGVGGACLLIYLLYFALLYEDFYLIIHQMLKKKLKMIVDNFFE